MTFEYFKKACGYGSLLLVLVLSGCTHYAVSNDLVAGTQQPKNPDSILWTLDSLTRVGGFSATAEGEPQLTKTPWGSAVYFDGDGDRLLVDGNPLGDAQAFTIEIIFNPDDAHPKNSEPRFFHIEAPGNPDRRITIELRLNDQQQWYLDAYIKSEKSQFTLIDPALVHPVGQWAHAAITFQERKFTSYVNGKKELEAEVDYLPIGEQGKASIGARMNRVHWFKGAILAVRITPSVLSAEEFFRPF